MSLFPISQPTEQERRVVSSTPAVPLGLNLYRTGGYRDHNGTLVTQHTAIPHPQNVNYPSIHTAQRKQARDEEMGRIMRARRHDQDIRNQTWIRPMHESAFQIHRPNIHNFNKVLHLKVPDGFAR